MSSDIEVRLLWGLAAVDLGSHAVIVRSAAIQSHGCERSRCTLTFHLLGARRSPTEPYRRPCSCRGSKTDLRGRTTALERFRDWEAAGGPAIETALVRPAFAPERDQMPADLGPATQDHDAPRIAPRSIDADCLDNVELGRANRRRY
jgi:hypothetical protein